MENITSTEGLKNAIQLLEAEQAIKGQELKIQFLLTYESLKPINILKSTFKDVTSSPYFIDNIIGSALGLTTGYFSKKLVVGASVNTFRKLFGSALEFGVTNIIAQNASSLKSVGQYLISHLFRKKDVNMDANV